MTTTPANTTPARLMPARPSTLTRDLLPVIPDWWPRPSDEHPTEDARAHARHVRAVAEAVQGPWDGHIIRMPAGAPEAEVCLSGAPGFRYVLDEAESDSTHLVYRYSPGRSGRAHLAAMTAVSEAFLEAGVQYATDAAAEAAADTPEARRTSAAGLLLPPTTEA